jgi:hypothetical protein
MLLLHSVLFVHCLFAFVDGLALSILPQKGKHVREPNSAQVSYITYEWQDFALLKQLSISA